MKPKIYSVSDFDCDDVGHLLHVNGTINSESWNGFPPRWVCITRGKGVRRDDGTWVVSMRVAVDPKEWAIHLADMLTGEKIPAIHPYKKVDFSNIIPAGVVLTEIGE